MTGAAPTLTVRIPLAIRRRGGRKLVVAPEVTPSWAPAPARVDGTLVKALARAYRWKRVLEGGRHGTIAELAAAEKINESYLCRILRLTLLAPDIVEAILDGRQPIGVQLPALMKPTSADWSEQRTRILGAGTPSQRSLASAPAQISPESTQREGGA